MKLPWINRKKAAAQLLEARLALGKQRREFENEIEDSVKDRQKTLEALINEVAKVRISTPPGHHKTFQLAIQLPEHLFMEMTSLNQMGDAMDHIARTIMHKVRQGLYEFVRGDL